MSALIFTLLLHLLATLPSPTKAGLTIGSVSSTSTCYDALTESSGDDNLVDKEEYVTFINILSDNFFTYPQFNPETNEYGNLPVSEFFQLPIELQMNFNTLACGGAFVSCPNAYLVADGAGSGDSPTDQQTIYLYEVCSNTEDSIDVAKAAVEEAEKLTNSPITSSPVKSPTAAPSGSPTVDSLSNTVAYYSKFQYQIQVSEGLTASAVMTPTHQMNIDLVTGMNDWSAGTCEEWNNMTVSRRRLRGRRLLAVTTELNPSNITNVTDVACSNSTKANDSPSARQWLPPEGDHCLLITQGQTYYLTGNTAEEDLFVFVSSEFNEDIEDGSYLKTIPEPSRSAIRTIYPSSGDDESSPPDTGTKPNPSPTPPATVDTITPDEKGGSNTAAIAAGVSVSLLVIICALFVARRRMMSEELKDDELESVDGDDKSDSDSSSHSGSSRSSSFSGSSSSGSDSSNSTSDSSKSYYSNSGSTSGAGTSVTGDGPVSVSASESDSHSHPREAPKVEESKARAAVDILNSAKVHDSMDSGSSVGEASLVEEAAIEEIDSDSDHDSHSDDDDDDHEYEMSVDLTDAAGLEVPHIDRRDSSSAGDSSAGSSGWNSSPGESSSANTESVESFDANMVDLGSSTISKTDADESDEYALDRELLPGAINPAVNPVIQPQVSILPVDNMEDDDSAFSSDDSDYSASSPMRSDAPPLGHEIQAAIDQGDWSAVGATAAILAPDDPSPTTSEMDTLVNSGNWSGIVAVAAKYADDASIQSGPFPSDHGSTSSRHRANSISSASVETADDSYWTQSQSSVGPMSQVSNATDMLSVESSSFTGSSYSNTSYSATGTQSGTGTGSSYVTGTSAEGVVSEISGGRTQSSSGRLSSLTSNKSHHEQSASTSSSIQNKQRIDAYRSEVEALVRRVVPDEIDNVDSIMVQFSGREEELIATLRGMQEKTIAQRAKAAVQRSAKKEAKTGGRIPDDCQSSEASSVRDSYTTSAASVEAPMSMASTNDGSITEEFANDDSDSESEDDTYTTDSAYGTEEGSRSEYSSATSHSASEYTSRSESGSSGYSSRQSQGISQDMSKDNSESLMNDMLDTGDWDGIVNHARTMRERASEEDLD